MNPQELIINQLDTISKDVNEIRKEQVRQYKILAKLESSDVITNNRCALTHKAVDEKLESLLNARLKKENSLSDWKTWGIRILFTVPVSIFISVAVVFLKGCA